MFSSPTFHDFNCIFIQKETNCIHLSHIWMSSPVLQTGFVRVKTTITAIEHLKWLTSGIKYAIFYKKDCVSSQLFIWQSSFCIRLPFPRISWWIVLPSQGYKTLSLPLIYLHALRLPTARLYKWKQETASTYLKQRRFQSQAIFSKSFFWNLQSKTFRTRFSQHSAFHKMNTQLAAEAHLRDYESIDFSY